MTRGRIKPWVSGGGAGLRIAAFVIAVGLVAPVLAGLVGALLPAAGFFPALGGTALSLEPARDFLATP